MVETCKLLVTSGILSDVDATPVKPATRLSYSEVDRVLFEERDTLAILEAAAKSATALVANALM